MTALDQVRSLLLEHGVIVSDRDQLIVAKTFSIGDVCKVRIAGLAELSDHQWLVQLLHKQFL